MRMKLLEMLNYIDGRVIATIESQFERRFFHLVPRKIKKENPITSNIVAVMGDDMMLEDSSDDRFELRYRRSIDVSWMYDVGHNYNVKTKSQHFRFALDCHINETSGVHSEPRIIDPILKDIVGMQIQRERICDEYEFRNYNHPTSDYFDGNFIGKLSEVLRMAQPSIILDSYHVSIDLIQSTSYLSDTLAEIQILSNYLYDFLENRTRHQGEDLFTYFPTNTDQRFFMLAEHYIQLQYNHWDKLGDILAAFFSTGLPEQRIYFPAVIDKLSEEVGCVEYEWLKDFRDGDYKALNTERKKIVHYSGKFAGVSEGWQKNLANEMAIKQIQDGRLEMLNRFKHLQCQLEPGIENVLRMIESELPAR